VPRAQKNCQDVSAAEKNVLYSVTAAY